MDLDKDGFDDPLDFRPKPMSVDEYDPREEDVIGDPKALSAQGHVQSSDWLIPNPTNPLTQQEVVESLGLEPTELQESLATAERDSGLPKAGSGTGKQAS